jgi:hypothetical protein
MPASRVGPSRIRPANDRETSRNDWNGWSIESAGHKSDSAIAAGGEIGPEDTLKVETRVRTPLGLQAQSSRSGRWSRSGRSTLRLEDARARQRDRNEQRSHRADGATVSRCARPVGVSKRQQN